MRVITQAGSHRAPVVQDGVNATVVCTDDGTPVLIVLNIAGRLWTQRADEPGFVEMLREVLPDALPPVVTHSEFPVS